MMKDIVINFQFKKPSKKTIGYLLAGLLVGLAISGYFLFRYITRDVNPIPARLRSDLNFSAFVIPTDTANYLTSDYKFSYAEDKVQILSYIVRLPSGDTVSISEYPQPQEFTDITEYKDRFLTNIANQYETIPTSNGTIYLGRATKQNNKQLGVMIERGLIVFISPSTDLDTDTWRNIGDRLEIQKNDEYRS